MKSILLVFVLIFITTSCTWIGNKISPTWMGTYYPGGSPYNENTWVNKFGFKSLEACQSWARSMVKSPEDEYECGKNCVEDQPGLFVCEETQ